MGDEGLTAPAGRAGGAGFAGQTPHPHTGLGQ